MALKIPSWVKPGALMTTVESDGDREDVGENDGNAKVRSYRVMRGARGALTVEVRGRGNGGEEALTMSVEDFLIGVSMELPTPFPEKHAVTQGDLTLVFRLVGRDSYRLGGSLRPCRHIQAPLEDACSCSGSGPCPACGDTGAAKPAKSIDIWVDDATGIVLRCGFYNEGELGSMLRLTSTNIFGPAPVKAKSSADAGKRRR